MKKNLLVMAALFAGAFTYAQECTAVADLNEDFSDFTIGTSGVFPQQCWSSITSGGVLIYTAQSGDPANQYATFYGSTAVNVKGYLVAPELSEAAHTLSFKTWKLAGGQGGNIPAGNVTVQVGTITNIADATTFTAVGDPIVLSTGDISNNTDIAIPAVAAGSHLAFEVSADAVHNAIAIDDVAWTEVEVPVTCEAVATLDENFNDFATSFDRIDVNCWTSNPSGGLLYISGGEGENYPTFYTSGVPGATGFLVTPELTTIDGNHELSFDSGLASPTSIVTIQLGTLATVGDFENFQPFGEPITVTADGVSTTGIVFPASETQKYIAFKFTGEGAHDGAFVDNVKWDATAGVNDLTKGAFVIYPNPTATKNITINFADASEKNLVSVYSLTGAKVLETEVTGSQNLNLSALSAGMYIVKAQSGNATSSQKLVIQ